MKRLLLTSAIILGLVTSVNAGSGFYGIKAFEKQEVRCKHSCLQDQIRFRETCHKMGMENCFDMSQREYAWCEWECDTDRLYERWPVETLIEYRDHLENEETEN